MSSVKRTSVITLTRIWLLTVIFFQCILHNLFKKRRVIHIVCDSSSLPDCHFPTVMRNTYPSVEGLIASRSFTMYAQEALSYSVLVIWMKLVALMVYHFNVGLPLSDQCYSVEFNEDVVCALLMFFRITFSGLRCFLLCFVPGGSILVLRVICLGYWDDQ